MISNSESYDWDDRPGEQLVTESQWNEIGSVLELTRRELAVCQRLFVEMTRQETANDMGIKSRTVRHYMEQIHSKLNVKNRVGVVLRIIQVRDSITPGELADPSVASHQKLRQDADRQATLSSWSEKRSSRSQA